MAKRFERPDTASVRRARFATLRTAGWNEIVEILHGESHARPWGEYMWWFMSPLLDTFERMPKKGQARKPWSLTLRPEIHVRDHVIVPDFAGWHGRRVRATQRSALCQFSSDRYVHAPDWICDVVEPSHADFVRTRKASVYLELGVSHLWLLDPVAHRLEVYTAGPGGWRLTSSYEGRGTVRAAPLKHLELDLGQLWPNLDEIEAAERKAIVLITERLDACQAQGVSEEALLRMLLAEWTPPLSAGNTFTHAQDIDHVLMRAFALVWLRVPLADVLGLARLELAAEAEARKLTTRDEARAFSEEYRALKIQRAIDDIAAGRVFTSEEAKAQLGTEIEASWHARRNDSQPLRGRIEALAEQFHELGTLSEELERQAIYGPDTRLIPNEHLYAVAREAIKRLALPFHDDELAKRIRVLREVCES